MTTAELTQREATDLDRCEIVIEKGIKTFVAVGNAMLEIRDRKLYRTTYGTFEDYCAQRWQLDRQYAYRIMDSARVHAALDAGQDDDGSVPGLSPIGDKPVNEAQARPLTPLLPKPDATPTERKQAERQLQGAWREAVETAPRTAHGQPKVTAAHVARTVTRRAQRAATSPPGEQLAAVPSNDDLDAQLESEMADTAERFRSEFATAMAKADDVMEFDMDRIAEVIDRDKLARYLRSWRRWCDEIDSRTKPGLRVVGGSR